MGTPTSFQDSTWKLPVPMLLIAYCPALSHVTQPGHKGDREITVMLGGPVPS